MRPLEQEDDLSVLQGQGVGDRPLLAPGEDVGEIADQGIAASRKQHDCRRQ